MSFKPFSTSAPVLGIEEFRREIEQLPEEERSRIRADLYGTTAPPVETVEQRSAGLQALTEAMDHIASSDKQFYNQAVQRCPEHVHDPSFLLKFLRCERYDAKKAAKRLTVYWEKKVKIWGSARAFRPLSMADFTDADQHALALGGIRLLPQRDQAGRALILVDKTRYDQRIEYRRSMYRLCWYMNEMATEDIEVQRNGIVSIIGSPLRPTTLMEEDRKLDAICFSIVRDALPLRVVGIHHYVSSRALDYVVPKLLALFGGDLRRRYKWYASDDDSFLSGLKEHGILPSVLPSDLGGTSTFDYAEWLQQRRNEQQDHL